MGAATRVGGIDAMSRFARLIRDASGATAIEYGLIVALIVIALITALNLIASSTFTMWNGVSENVHAAANT
jgi:pilus assembly protein Flp/PilA